MLYRVLYLTLFVTNLVEIKGQMLTKFIHRGDVHACGWHDQGLEDLRQAGAMMKTPGKMSAQVLSLSTEAGTQIRYSDP